MNLAQRINQFTNFQRTVRALNKLDGRQLADIGVVRDDIAALARRKSI